MSFSCDEEKRRIKPLELERWALGSFYVGNCVHPELSPMAFRSSEKKREGLHHRELHDQAHHLSDSFCTFSKRGTHWSAEAQTPLGPEARRPDAVASRSKAEYGSLSISWLLPTPGHHIEGERGERRREKKEKRNDTSHGLGLRHVPLLSSNRDCPSGCVFSPKQ